MTNEPNWTGITDYLTKLAGAAGDTTYRSHKTALLAYDRWCASKGITAKEGQPVQAANFLESRFSDREYSLETAYGHLCTLSNFHAATKRADPELEQIRIVTHLDGSAFPSGKVLRQRICDQFSADTSPNGTSDNAVKALVAHLRQCCYGSRTHVVTEVLLDTKGRINPIRNLDVDDLDQETGTVEIGVPEQFLVANFLSGRTVGLSEDTFDAIQTYLRYERKDTYESDTNPLFTTREGRVSTSTLRRAIQRKSRTALTSRSDVPEYPDHENQNKRTIAGGKVFLSDVRWIAIKSWLK